MDTVCRICMEQGASSNESFRPITQDIIDMVEFCTGVLIQKKDGYPSQICNKCLTDVHIARRLKIKCVDSEKALHRLNSKFKQENNDTSLVVEAIKIEVDVEFEHCDIDCDNGNVECATSIENSKEIDASVKEKAHTMDKEGVKKEKQPRAKRKNIIDKPTRGVKFKRLFCEPCQMRFVNRKESEEHKNRMHKDKQVWICEVCGKSYAHRSSQIAHMRSHYPERHSCHDCDYSTHNKYDLIKHVKIHTGDKSFKCAQCPAAYRTSSNLRAHVRSRHERRPAVAVTSLACPVCERACADRAALDKHVHAHYVKRHACELCNARFSKRIYMTNHLLKQHGVTIPKVRPGRQKTDVLILKRGGKDDSD